MYLLIRFLYFASPPPLSLLVPLVCCLFLFFYICSFVLFFRPHIKVKTQCLSFSVWLISLSIIPSGSIHIVENGKISFFIMTKQYSIGNIYRESSSSLCPFLYLWTLQLNLLDNAAMNIAVHISSSINVFIFSKYPGVDLLDHIILFFLILWGTSIHFPLWLYQFTFPARVHKGSFFPTTSTLTIYCLFHNRHSEKCEVISHCLCLLVIVGKMPIQIFCPCFNQVFFFFFILSCINFLYILDINLLLEILFANIFSHSVGCLFILLVGCFHCAKAF